MLFIQPVERKLTQVCQPDRKSTHLYHSVSQNVGLALHSFASALVVIYVRRVRKVVVQGHPLPQISMCSGRCLRSNAESRLSKIEILRANFAPTVCRSSWWSSHFLLDVRDAASHLGLLQRKHRLRLFEEVEVVCSSISFSDDEDG